MRFGAPIYVVVFALATLLADRAASADASPAATRAIDTSTAHALRGDIVSAVAVLAAEPANAFEGKDADYRACVLGRFDRATVPYLAAGVEDDFVQAVLAAYQSYWWHALKAPAARAQHEAALAVTLRRLLAREAQGVADRDARVVGDSSDVADAGGAVGAVDAVDSAAVETASAADSLDTLEAPLKRALEARGYHALLGVTSPLRELMLWRKQERRDFDVALVEGSHRVRVELLDDFATLGWNAYARCNRGSTGGWATADAIYAVLPGYPDGIASEKFRVVLLLHEAQHFADQQRYDLEPWELEYRAKLAELVAASAALSRVRLTGFLAATSDDRGIPHAYANARVAAALRERLGAAPDTATIEALQAAARALLIEDSRRRARKSVAR